MIEGVLTGDEIERRNIITPFTPRTEGTFSFGVGFCGYDIRLDQELVLQPKKFTLGSSMESFDMPDDVVGILFDKSSRARRGLFVAQGVLEPCWRGHLTLEFFNAADEVLHLKTGEGIAQVIFFPLCKPVNGYNGKYQDQKRGPQPAK